MFDNFSSFHSKDRTSLYRYRNEFQKSATSENNGCVPGGSGTYEGSLLNLVPRSEVVHKIERYSIYAGCGRGKDLGK